MVAVINVFYRGNEDEKVFIETLVKYDFVHYVDSVRYRDPNWLQANTQKGKIYRYHGDVTGVNCIEGPGMFVLITDCKEENPCFYEDVEDFIRACYDGSVGLHLNEYYKLLDMFPAQKEKPKDQDLNKRNIEDLEEDLVRPDYTFESKHISEKDYMFYQLTKPNTDKPYVILVKNFSKHGHKRLFSSMKMFDSWGVSPSDINFLIKIWEYLDNTTPPDFEAIIKEHVDSVLGGEEEPKVWRNTMDTVIENYMRKNIKL